MTPETSRMSRLIVLAMALTMAATVGACGKRGGLKPPEGRAAEYTYPGFYPDPGDVITPTRAVPEEEEDAGETGEDALGEPFPPYDMLDERQSIRTYNSE